jgi:hypothetical protein
LVKIDGLFAGLGIGSSRWWNWIVASGFVDGGGLMKRHGAMVEELVWVLEVSREAHGSGCRE